MRKYARAQDMDSWLQDQRIAERGFAHRWQSQVAGGNGEDAFITLVDNHLKSDFDVADLGCGHGEFTLNLAARCRTIAGIERNPEYLALASELASERKVTNATFFQANLAGPNEKDRPFAGLPLPDHSIDLFVNRRGPILARYLHEAIRVGRPGAAIIGLHPAGNAPAPSWYIALPEVYQSVFQALPYSEVAGWVTIPLGEAGITDYSLWWIDVPEFLRTPHELYFRLGGAEIPGTSEYQDVEPFFKKIFEKRKSSQGIVLRHQRLLWLAYLPK